LARERSPFIDQGQSLNVHFKNGPQLLQHLETYILHVGLVQRLKTILYYARTIQDSPLLGLTRDAKKNAGSTASDTNAEPAVATATSNPAPTTDTSAEEPGSKDVVCTDDVCTMCSS
jgi:ribonucleotide reductase alpha subunit